MSRIVDLLITIIENYDHVILLIIVFQKVRYHGYSFINSFIHLKLNSTCTALLHV